MTNSISIKARDCCLKENKRLMETLNQCDIGSTNVKNGINAIKVLQGIAAAVQDGVSSNNFDYDEHKR